eukprot:g499.t1
MRGAGCTINDMWDRKFDASVARTLNRPLASGRVSPFAALCFLGAQLTAGLGVLLQLNNYSIALGASSLGLVALYPLAKRYVALPQVVLGLTFNWGALLGWAAVHGSCDWAAVLPLYGACISWTMIYDTLYAHQDKDDDAKLGLRSSALTFGGNTKPWLYGFAATNAALLSVAGDAAGLAWPFYASVAAATGHLGWQISTADLNDRVNLNTRFVSNTKVGGIIMAGIVAGKVLG